MKLFLHTYLKEIGGNAKNNILPPNSLFIIYTSFFLRKRFAITQPQFDGS